MLIEEVIARSRWYKGRKYENMTVLQRLRCDLLNKAADYEHTHMHERNPAKADKAIADELVDIAQNYAWRYSKHKQLLLIDELLGSKALDDRWSRILHIKKAEIELELQEYQQQFKNMTLM